MKKCNKCKKTKPFSEYYQEKKGKYRYVCRLCDNKLSNERRKAGGWKYEKTRQGKGTNHSKLSKINSQKHRTEMSDMYIRSLITKKSKILKSEDISDEFIIVYRENLKLKRFLRKQKQPT